MKSVAEVLKNRVLKKDTRNTHEYQAYGNWLADQLADPQHRALYIKLAKNEDRNLLELAREHVVASPNATTKGRLFMWKLKQLKENVKQEPAS